MKKLLISAAIAAISASSSFAAQAAGPLVATATNGANNQVLVYDTTGKLVATLPTQGEGGAAGNAGGLTYGFEHLAVVNFGSSNVTVFEHDADHSNFIVSQIVPAASNPLSVALSADHLYILGTKTIESHRIDTHGIDPRADGIASLVLADGSAAQVGVLTRELVIAEKNNVIETVKLDASGAVTGATSAVANIPANVNAPFGLATRGNDAYVTIAHANEISLVRNDAVLATTPSNTQHAPCWATLDGPFLFTANAASGTVSRYAVYGQKIVQDAAVAATVAATPLDIAYRAGTLGLVDHSATGSDLSIYSVDEDGNLTRTALVNFTVATTNGVAVIPAAAAN